ncbi:MAG: glycoside hydrolase family 127 protein [Actinomycetales bacterium]|nr:glycoside hydrolase family 127 protein [Actinomycetales bacterium]
MTVGVHRATTPGGPVVPTPAAHQVLRPLGHDAVTVRPTGWLAGWRERALDATLSHVLQRVEEGEARGNLARLLGDGEPVRGMPFTDSDVYKTLEAFAWAAGSLDPDDKRLDRARELVALLARVQEADGYLNSWVQGHGGERWSDPQAGHELYTAGHLFQAAVAAQRTGALPGLMEIAVRFADLLLTRFADPSSPYVDGHPEVETALVELFRATGETSYLDLARHQIERRGHGWLGEGRFGSAYFLDAVPVRRADRATGHAVRQLYLLSGALDVAVETHDQELLDAVARVWTDLQVSKTYVTGAHGSRHRDESIGDAYELPPDRAYAETCAAIAAFHLGWRLLLATGEGRYADAMETLLHNAIAAAMSTDGTSFFYSNPLQVRTGHDGGHEDAPSRRLPWFSCACCPPNLARLLSGVQDYLVTATEHGIQIHHPTPATVDAVVAGAPVELTVRTGYPHDGRIVVEVEHDSPQPWELSLRIPGWCGRYGLTVDGVPTPAAADRGYVRLHRDWAGRHEVTLTLDMPVRLLHPHPRVDAVRGCVAVTRGPLVYALEEVDLPPGVVLEDVRLLAVLGVRATADGVPAPVVDVRVARELPPGDALYLTTPDTGTGEPFDVPLIPYHLWANRDPGAMRVWIPGPAEGAPR